MYFRYDDFIIHAVNRSNAVRLSLRVHANGDEVSLTVPPWATKSHIMRFLDENREWLREHAPKVSDFHPSYAAGEEHLLFGEWVTLGENGIPTGQAFVEYRLENLKDLLNDYFVTYQMRMRIPNIQRVTIKDMKSRWGSCRPSTGTISMASNLAMIPKECVEYIVVHELTHMHHPDHSPAFYAEVERYMPDWKERSDRMSGMDLRPRKGKAK